MDAGGYRRRCCSEMKRADNTGQRTGQMDSLRDRIKTNHESKMRNQNHEKPVEHKKKKEIGMYMKRRAETEAL